MVSVLPARNRHEAELCIAMLELDIDEAPTLDTSGIWHYKTKNPRGSTFELRFRIDDNADDSATASFPGGPTHIIAPDFLRHRIDQAFEISVLEPDDDTKRLWTQAIIYVDELDKMIPA